MGRMRSQTRRRESKFEEGLQLLVLKVESALPDMRREFEKLSEVGRKAPKSKIYSPTPSMKEMNHRTTSQQNNMFVYQSSNHREL